MDIHKHVTVERLEIVETGRRRRWSEDEKLWVVMESFSGPRLVAATARQHKTSRPQLSAWRRASRANAQGATADPVCVLAVISPLPTPGPEQDAEDTRTVIVVERANGLRDAGFSLIASFARGITEDLAAVRAAVTESWSNGHTEGHVNRQMYSRARLDLLEMRPIGAP